MKIVVASENGTLEVLKYLHENGRPWSEKCCEYIMKMDVLGMKCCENASEKGYLECLYVLSNLYQCNKNLNN